MNNPIYVPKGRAGEYGDYALNIYTGCPHRCWYCFAPSVLRKDKELFHADVRPRDGIVEAVKKQLDGGAIKYKLIHLCFTCDPYPCGYDTTVTRKIIKLIKASGNHVQTLTKNDETRDLDLLDGNDWYGVTLTGMDKVGSSSEVDRVTAYLAAHRHGINTWVSFEPVVDALTVLEYLRYTSADKVKIGKLNYHPSDIDWKEFGKQAERICKDRGFNYYIKEDLRREMERQ